MNASSATVGIIGLGSMGRPMAERLLAERGELVIHARRPQPELVAAGATWAESPRELAMRVDVMVSVLPDLPELEQLLDGPNGLLAGDRDLLILIASTSSAPAVRALGDRLHAQTSGRVRLVDCPVSGGEDGARAGTLSIMLGGAEADTALAAEVLVPCGTAVHLGPLGAGQVAKACNQLVVSATILALGEATVLADRSSIDLDRMWSLLAGGYAGSRLLEARHSKLVTGDDSASGMAKYMVKDLRFAADIAASTGTDAVLLPALRAAFDEIVDRGLGDRDISVTRRLVAERRPRPDDTNEF